MSAEPPRDLMAALKESLKTTDDIRAERDALARRVEALTEALDFIARSHHKTVTESRMHHPERRDYTECPCLTCKMATDAIALAADDEAARDHVGGLTSLPLYSDDEAAR